MARVAICPQCECEFFVPDGMDTAAWAKCPQCHEFLEVAKASARELPSALPVDTESHDEGTPSTLVGDLSNLDTWNLPDREPAPSADEDLVADTLLFDPPTAETPDEAAQRIDAWFRSAKTVADMGGHQNEAANAGPSDIESRSEESYRDDVADEPADVRDTTATVDISALGFGSGVDEADFEFDAPADSPREAAAWEDSQHIDSLLSDMESEPAAEFTLSDEASEAVAVDQEHAASGENWEAKVTASSLINAGKPRRKRSLVRTLVGTVVGGVLGLVIAYFALLWLRGPEIDFLQLAQYLPRSILPASFKHESRQLAAAPVRPAIEPAVPEATADETAKPTEEAPVTTDGPATPGDQPAGSADASADKTGEALVATNETKPVTDTGDQPASFNEPVAAPDVTKPDDNRYGEKSAASAISPTEPAPLDAPPATPLTTEKPVAPPAAEAVHVANAPSFAVDDVKAALQAAEAAQPKLVAGNLADGKEVAKAKGYGYSMLADLAQKVTFVDADTAADALQQADELFKKTLSDAHTRGEVTQIVPRWIAAPSRKHGGIFFAGSVASQNKKGSVTECSVDLGSGQSLTILVPPTGAVQLSSASQSVGVVGWVVDHPADQVAGYTGDATQAIFVSRLIPLQ